MSNTGVNALREPWNKGKIVREKAPFKFKNIWAIRVRFQMEHWVRELALFNRVSTASCVGASSSL